MKSGWKIEFLDNIERIDKWRETAYWAIGIIENYESALETISYMGPDEAETEAKIVAKEALEKNNA